VERSPDLDAPERAALISQLHAEGLDLRSLAGSEDPILTALVERSVAESARTPVLFAAALVAIGAAVRAPNRVFARPRRAESPPPLP
jgi:hypothetical protein